MVRLRGPEEDGVEFAVQQVVAAIGIGGLLALSVGGGTRLDDDFRRFFGPIPPVVAVVVALLTGLASMRILDSRGWIRFNLGDLTVRHVAIVVIAAAALSAVAIVADITIGFDEDVNVRWPGSLAFYAVIAVVAEVVFHLVPLAMGSLVVSTPQFDAPGRSVVSVLALVALIEAAFQVVASRAGGDALALTAFVAVHLIVIGLAQVGLFWYVGPWAMLLFRPAYYAFWHVGWGYLRLRAIF